MFKLPGFELASGARMWVQRSAVAAYFGAAALCVTSQPAPSAEAVSSLVSQTPLSVGGNVPGNLLLTPSVEYPTMDSVANLGDTYDRTRTYVGYFDSTKCYDYSYDAVEANRHFYPVGFATSNHECTGSWSGNFMNWAATQTIDPFRKALTGGYRVRDTQTETWLEKAYSDSNSSSTYFPNRAITSSSTRVRGATPANWGQNFYTRISRLGNKMRFTRASGRLGDAAGNMGNAPIPYEGSAVHPLNSDTDPNVYEVSIRVKVCVPGLIGAETNCKQYGSNYKPEGLIQQYSGRIRYSAFGYLNDDDGSRDGGVLRARQKFVGDKKLNPETGLWESNSEREWDPDTGVLVDNPNPNDASATSAVIGGGMSIPYSGVINYINKFGQATNWSAASKSTKTTNKSIDPVSELYYTAIRYLKNQGNVSAYTNLGTGSAQSKFNLADGFPVITSWDDPIQYSCQNNAILGIGDVYTHRDKNLPGSGTSGDGEPTKPTAVANDTTVNVRTATAKVAELEGITINTSSGSWTGRNNSAFIAGLAYDSHTVDMRPNMKGKQTVSTYWVDVREGQTLEGRASNQYWLAAKYGGFTVPEGFDPYTRTAPLEASWWSSGQALSTGDQRPENFYVASEAEQMVQSLTRAFAKIAAEGVGSASSLAANSTRLETDTRTFQAQFNKGSWHGELNAYSVDTDGSLLMPAFWSASQKLPAWNARNILVNAGGTLRDFTWDQLTVAQQTALGSAGVVNYLRGDRSLEEAQAGGTLRTRIGILGDIVNSTPVYVGSPNARLYAASNFTGATAYQTFASSKTGRANRVPIVYVGANDGMLHAFDADTGVEVFAFVPRTVIANNLRSLSEPDYEHRYFVDGEIAAADIYDTSTNSWKTVLVGTLGRGGPGIFALDVTNPAAPSLLWELDGTNVPQLGKNIGRPVIAQVADGDWRVLLGNGPGASSGTGRAQLITVRLGSANNGAVTTVAVSDTSTNNGLTAPLARDTAGPDGFADTVYAGDLRGNLWKFSNIAGTPTVSKLFQATDASNVPQPITAAPLVGRNPRTGETWVFFGTGKYLHEDDLTDDQVQTWYGLKDTGAAISGRSNLVARDITAEVTIGADDKGTPDPSDDVPGTLVRAIESGNAVELGGKDGWYIDLVSPVNGVEGERMVVPNRFQGAALIGTTRIPEQADPCSPGGRGFVMAIDPFTGARLNITFFDVNGDGLFNEQDMICDAGNCVPASAIGFSSSPNNPIFIEDVMQVGLDDGSTRVIRTQGSAVQATRMSWRELLR